MVVLEHPLKNIYPEIDVVATPAGAPTAMVHCNNCTNDINAWVGMLRETAELFGAKVNAGDLYTALYKKSLEGAADCDGVLVYNYMAGEGVTHLDSGRPLVTRRPDSAFTLANFMRSQIYGTMATMCIGMEILHKENVAIDSLTGHGGLFKTPGVGQRYMAAACKAPVTCMETAGEGGPYGMALLASYMVCREEGESLGDYLSHKVFAGAKGSTLAPDPEDVKGFEAYLQNYVSGLAAEKAAVASLSRAVPAASAFGSGSTRPCPTSRGHGRVFVFLVGQWREQTAAGPRAVPAVPAAGAFGSGSTRLCPTSRGHGRFFAFLVGRWRAQTAAGPRAVPALPAWHHPSTADTGARPALYASMPSMLPALPLKAMLYHLSP